MAAIRMIRPLLVALVLIATAGCASTAEDQAEASRELLIEVEASPLIAGGTVHIVTPDGVRRFVGSLPGSGKSVFEVPGPALTGQYRLIAQGAGGRTIASRPFTMQEPGIRWDLYSNIILPMTG